ncbi:uncharacterized protein JCM6883_002819 [Sporobolomyces salmoneus]|uniref:uncharacterized protein n=1 Tax=Sporobolomyces salmoneus TaxID=183962 RepID=UPI003173ABFE
MSYPYGGQVQGQGGPPYASQQYSSSDFISPRDDELQTGNLRPQQTTYPPQLHDYNSDDVESLKAPPMGGYGQTMSSGVPVTRGSIAAQMAAEGQIPKKVGLKMYRKDEHAGALTRGGKFRCCGRVVCCTIMLVVLIIVGIVAAFFLWVKPPDVSFNGIEPPSNGQEVSVVGSGFNINVRLNIGVINPNFFGASFDKISATAYYPTKPDDAIGGGTLDDVEIPKNSNSTIHFPFSINYTTSYDSDLSVLKDIATKCGFLGGSSGKEDLKVNYKVETKVKVIAVSVSPTFSSSASFACPLSESDLKGFLGSSDLSSLGLGSLSGALGGLGSRLRLAKRDDLIEEGQRALEKIYERGWEVLRERDLGRRMRVMERKEREGEKGVFDSKRRFRIGTLGPRFPLLR